MLPKKGKALPRWTGVLRDRATYAQTVADLLRKEHGDIHRAIKQLMRQTDASERSVKHWLAGQHGPDTVHFLRLVVSSSMIRAFALGLIESPAAASHTNAVDRLSLAGAREAYAMGETDGRGPARNAALVDPELVPEGDPMNVPDTAEVNERQRWFLARVAAGRCDARAIATTWTVSLKTARRDIAVLKAADLICYIGSPRKGRYLKT